MKTITVQKTVTEEIQMPELPFYSIRFNSFFFMINEFGVLTKVNSRQITVWGTTDSYYGESVLEALNSEPCSEKDFDTAYRSALDNIKEAVNPPADSPALNTMNNIDPNAPQGAINDQEAIREQATQASGETQAADEKEPAAEGQGALVD